MKVIAKHVDTGHERLVAHGKTRLVGRLMVVSLNKPNPLSTYTYRMVPETYELRT